MQVAVVGGGLAGLFTASQLVHSGVDDIVILEASDDPGGVVGTIRRDGYVLEPAAGTLMLPHPQLGPLLERAGVEVVPVRPEGSRRYVYTRGRMVAVPSSPMALLTPLVPWTAKLRGAAEPFIRTPSETGDESVDSFLRRRFGIRLGGALAWLAASGVFAGDPARLSVRAAFPVLSTLEDEAGSIVAGVIRRMRERKSGARPSSHLPVGGMVAVAEGLAVSIGDRFRAGFEVDSVRQESSGWRVEGEEVIEADHVVLAVPPGVAGGMVDDALSATLSGAVAAPVVTVGLGGRASDVPLPPGFGVLTGPDVSGVIRGVLFESSYAPGRAPEGHHLAKVIAGGAPSPDVIEWSDGRLLETLVEEMNRLLATEISPSFIEIVRHRPGIPQYEVGHLRWLDDLDGMLADRPGLHLTGWGYRGVGVAHVAADAVAVAERVLERVGQTS